MRQAGADHALVSGSGPTVFGLFWGENGSDRATRAQANVRQHFPAATVADPVQAEFGEPRRSDES